MTIDGVCFHLLSRLSINSHPLTHTCTPPLVRTTETPTTTPNLKLVLDDEDEEVFELDERSPSAVLHRCFRAVAHPDASFVRAVHLRPNDNPTPLPPASSEVVGLGLALGGSSSGGSGGSGKGSKWGHDPVAAAAKAAADSLVVAPAAAAVNRSNEWWAMGYGGPAEKSSSLGKEFFELAEKCVFEFSEGASDGGDDGGDDGEEGGYDVEEEVEEVDGGETADEKEEGQEGEDEDGSDSDIPRKGEHQKTNIEVTEDSKSITSTTRRRRKRFRPTLASLLHSLSSKGEDGGDATNGGGGDGDRQGGTGGAITKELEALRKEIKALKASQQWRLDSKAAPSSSSPLSKAATPAADVTASPHSAPTAAAAAVLTLKDDPMFSKYFKMLKVKTRDMPTTTTTTTSDNN